MLPRPREGRYCNGNSIEFQFVDERRRTREKKAQQESPNEKEGETPGRGRWNERAIVRAAGDDGSRLYAAPGLSDANCLSFVFSDLIVRANTLAYTNLAFISSDKWEMHIKICKSASAKRDKLEQKYVYIYMCL